MFYRQVHPSLSADILIVIFFIVELSLYYIISLTMHYFPLSSDGKDPVILEDKEYPDWVHELTKPVSWNVLFIC
jgi:hypothetical protein